MSVGRCLLHVEHVQSQIFNLEDCFTMSVELGDASGRFPQPTLLSTQLTHQLSVS